VNLPIGKNHQLIISRSSQLSRLAAKILEKNLAPLGITFQEFRIAGLLISDDNITQKDLAEKLSVRPATLSVAISKLESRGIVERVPSDSDKRVNYLRLVPDNNNNFAEMHLLLNNLENEICSGISAKELQTTKKVLGLIADNLIKLNQ
jgi:DNA-binding MarR family transcriptional regulator